MRDPIATPLSHGAATAGVMPALAAASRRQGLDDLATRLLSLRALLAEDLQALEGLLADVGQHGADVAWAAGRYLVARPGKRARPICVLLAARLGGRGADQAVLDCAAAVELVHAATLLHDDVLDLGEERRGAPSARMVYGNAASVLGGDHLLVDALRRVRSAPLAVQHALVDVIARMVEAEAQQLERRGRFDGDRAAYLQVIAGKTAVLFRWALQAGGALAELSDQDLDRLGRIGDGLGAAFQLVDDVIDLEGDPAVTGKSAYADLREGKLTWPLILASERVPGLRERLAAFAAAAGEVDDLAAVRLVREVRDCGALADTRAEAAARTDAARALLAELPAGAARDALSTVIDTILARAR